MVAHNLVHVHKVYGIVLYSHTKVHTVIQTESYRRLHNPYRHLILSHQVDPLSLRCFLVFIKCCFLGNLWRFSCKFFEGMESSY
jgi:hypothetical protein